MRHGILYQLTFPSGKVYIGITRETLAQRIRRHVAGARAGRHYAVSAAIRKYGERAFTAQAIGQGSWEELQQLEIAAISANKAAGRGCYNMTGGGEGSLGVSLSLETKAKISRTLMGRVGGFSEIHRRRLSEVQRGKVIPPEVRAKMSAAAIHRCSQPMSAEQKEKIRAALIGKKRGPYKKRKT